MYLKLPITKAQFNRHESKKVCEHFLIRYVKPNEWKKLGEVMVGLDLNRFDIVKKVFEHKELYAIEFEPSTSDLFSIENNSWRERDDLLLIHPHGYLKLLKRKQTYLINKEIRLIKKIAG